MTFLHVRDSDSIGPQVLVFSCPAMVFHLQQSGWLLCLPWQGDYHLQIKDSNLGNFYIEHEPFFPCRIEPVIAHGCCFFVIFCFKEIIRMSSYSHLYTYEDVIRSHHSITHLYIGVNNLSFLCTVWPGNMLPRDDLHWENKNGEEWPIVKYRHIECYLANTCLVVTVRLGSR